MPVKKAKPLFFLLVAFSAALFWMSTYGIKYLPTDALAGINTCLKANPPVIHWNVAATVLKFFM
ncbi:MAG: hypothetical protein EOO01_09480 [Chitinophagaceae bacterium]|nr:MAG: hypothetical protein EOO01_09480 [Chitinophagaceae bacterium]